MNTVQEIFLVHDQQESAVPRRSFLEMSGYRVTLMKSGVEVLAALSERVPALVLMDILLDGPNGFEVCRQIRARFAPQKLPILLSCMVYRSRIYRDEALHAGAQGYILRPVKLEDLVQQVGEALTGQSSTVDVA